MERGIWTLRCQLCSKEFEIEVRPGEKVIEYAKGAACPHCYTSPGAKMESEVSSLWHHIIGFKNTKPD
jgi:hypothetical protein